MSAIKLERQPGADSFDEMLARLGDDREKQNIRRYWLLRWLEQNGIDVSDLKPARGFSGSFPPMVSDAKSGIGW